MSTKMKTKQKTLKFSGFNADAHDLTVDAFVDLLASLPTEKRTQWYGPSVGEAAQWLGVSRQRIYKLIQEGKVKSVMLRIEMDPKDRWLIPLASMVTIDSLKHYHLQRGKRGSNMRSPKNPWEQDDD